ncbi:hypothetical protein M0805_006288 [Coniferiporia weirii]|nr:hypothetical protein M0805_006288 [Coniferiporia weirii]
MYLLYLSYFNFWRKQRRMSNQCTQNGGTSSLGGSTHAIADIVDMQEYDTFRNYLEHQQLLVNTQGSTDDQHYLPYLHDPFLPEEFISQDYLLPRNFPSSSDNPDGTQGFTVGSQIEQDISSWAGPEYIPSIPCPPEFLPFGFDNWEEPPSQLYGVNEFEYRQPFSEFNLSSSLSDVGSLLDQVQYFDQQPSNSFPLLQTFAPTSPFLYGSAGKPSPLVVPFHLVSPQTMHADQPIFTGHTGLPLLPLHSNEVEDASDSHQDQCAAPPSIIKRSRADKRNSKPLTVQDLTHDNSRFAKVVKAFLSIEEQENRTVPEIAKKVSELCAGQYADFEGVKRMVNDVLQKHKAFWHPGRGSPYQLNLAEGRARREFPSNIKYHMRSQYDENLTYSRNTGKRRTNKHTTRNQKTVTNAKPDIVQPLPPGPSK